MRFPLPQMTPRGENQSSHPPKTVPELERIERIERGAVERKRCVEKEREEESERAEFYIGPSEQGGNFLLELKRRGGGEKKTKIFFRANARKLFNRYFLNLLRTVRGGSSLCDYGGLISLSISLGISLELARTKFSPAHLSDFCDNLLLNKKHFFSRNLEKYLKFGLKSYFCTFSVEHRW